MSLTVACVWVKGNVDYGVEYVTKLHAMCKRWIANSDFHFVCFTDRPDAIHRIMHESMRWVSARPKQLVRDCIYPQEIPSPGSMFGWWSKVELFNPRHGLKGRVLYLDLDTLIVDDLGPLIHFPAEFALVPHAGTFNGKNGLQVVKRFNSSCMVWDAGTQDHIYENWSPAVTKRLHGDQDWIGEQCQDAAMFQLSWFPRLSEIQWPDVPKDAKVVLAKKPKNVTAAKTMPGFAEAWG